MFIIFLFLPQNAEETMAVVQRVVGDAGGNTDTFCRWLMSQKMEVGGPLSGICHWFVNPEKKLHRPRIGHFHPNRHLINNEIPDLAESEVHTNFMVSGHLHESTSISIIMILATVLFILLVTAFVTCITRKKRRVQVRCRAIVMNSDGACHHRSDY